ncbi:MAG TPA: pyrimidine-nucleoside phosphorylase [Bacilli bacterium]|nr:pyrimidine-nucleoside phosphorylase [Bacilli bacterium]
MRAVDIIIKKRQGLELTKEEIHFIIDGYVKGEIPDYQVSALLMAICFQGLNSQEQIDLTMEMLNSGEKIDLSSIKGVCVDKHSTGGVGDKTTLVIAPIVAACGLKIAKMSGRGLGHTGGTLDKLEAIPGFKIAISPEDFFKQVQEIGIAVVGQTANITPADKKLYALRDVTGTVDSVGLIAGSIMSKKLASGAESILLDVKVGDGAFMQTLEEAQVLARAMVNIGNSCHKKTVAMLTDMDQPLGEAVGNSLEVIEVIETLKGHGPKDFTALCREICLEMLLMTNFAPNLAKANHMIDKVLTDGSAMEKFRQMIIYQGGNPEVVNDYQLFAQAKNVITVRSEKTGYIKKIHTHNIGDAAMILGAGRKTKDDIIDPSVGLKVIGKVGDFVTKGDILAQIYANGKEEAKALAITQQAFEITNELVKKNKIVLDIIK